MTGAAVGASLTKMRSLLILPLSGFAMMPVAAAAQAECGAVPSPLNQAGATTVPTPLVAIGANVPLVPALLAPLAADSPWLTRFEAAADALLPALRSGNESHWRPLLGGQWLGETEFHAVKALLNDRCGAFAPVLHTEAPVARRILGWSIDQSYSDAERAALAARPEAEALVCWSAHSDTSWPRTAKDADNAPARPYACVRITYSVRGDTPVWRGFIEAS